MGSGVHMLRRQVKPQHLMNKNSPLSFRCRKAFSMLTPCFRSHPKALRAIHSSFIIYISFTALIIDFFLSFSSESFRRLTTELYLPQYCMPPFFSQLLYEKVITSVFTNFSLNANTPKYTALFLYHTQLWYFTSLCSLSEAFSEPALILCAVCER